MVDLTISIVNTNNKELLEGCLRSIFKNTSEIVIEVYVVDNNSTDNSAEMVRSRFPQVQVIENKIKQGYAENHNKVLREGRGRYICVLNEDIVIYQNAFGKMIDFMDQHPDVGAVGPQILEKDGVTVQLECARAFPTLWTEFCDRSSLAKIFPKSRILGGVNLGYWDHNDTREVDCLLGACMVVRAEVLNEVGLLDEQFFMYGEDVDWPYRMKKRGWKIMFLHEAQLLHYKGRSNLRRPRKMGIELFHSQSKFFRKHYGRVYAWMYRALIFLISFTKLLFFSGLLAASRRKKTRTGYLEKVRLHAYVLRWAISGVNPITDNGQT